jgi:hypothetical protein
MTKPTLETIAAVSCFAFIGCGTDPYSGDGPAVVVYEISLTPVRKLDLVFMIDNSPGMAAKVTKMTARFPELLSALKDPTDGTYPDLRVAIIDSDLGTGGQYSAGSCGPNGSNGDSLFGDLGNFQMRGASSCGVTSDLPWLEYSKGQAVNYSSVKDISQVFACLTANLGEVGCGEEHALQAFEFALLLRSNDIIARDPRQDAYLRPDATLGLVFITDEDDCSAATNDGMFGDKAELRGESASLRCATRAHKCNGVNLTNPPPGYPTTAPFATSFSNCAARTDACPNQTDGTGMTDTSQPTSCSPLKDYKRLAAEIKSLKTDPSQILVAGIFGWPREGSEMASALYRIDLVPNPNSADTAHPQIYDYWPTCYEPNHLPQSSGFNADAWGWSAQGGLRLAAFVDEFGESGQKFSICESDFSNAMSNIGTAMARRLANVCVPSDFAQGKTCMAYLYEPVVDASGTVTYVAGTNAVPECSSDTTTPTIADCYSLVFDQTRCPGAQYRVEVRRTADEIAAGPLPENTKLLLRCQ